MLFVQTDAQNWEQAVDCSDRPGGGVVLTGDIEMLDRAKHIITRRNYTKPVLVDRDRYSGNTRKLAQEDFDRDWIDRQRRIALAAVMPDAGYIPEGDVDGLTSVLDQAQALDGSIDEDVIVPLALHVSWLDVDNGLDTLIEQVNRAGVAIGVALEHASDPLSAKHAVAGLAALLDTSVPVVVLRSDLSALGALSYGALAAAVGTRSALRHLYPSTPGGGFTPRPQVSTLVRQCLSYVSLDKLDQAIQADPDDPLWWCDCDACGGRNLSWIRSSPEPETSAYLHALETLYQIHRDILGRTATPSERQQSWSSQCSNALFQYDNVRHAVTDCWKRPVALDRWLKHRPMTAT